MPRQRTRYLDACEVAAREGVTTTTVWRWCRRGLVESRRTPGGRVRIAIDQTGFARPAARSSR